jgi:DNA-binding CsgD family transcriptional regulator
MKTTTPYNLEEMASICLRKYPVERINDYSRFIPGEHFEKILNQSSLFFFSIDFSRMRYIFLSQGVKNVLGYDRSTWFKEGLNFAFKILLPQDRQILKKIHNEMFDAYYSTPVAKRKKFSFTFDYNVIDASGDTVRLNQRTVFAEIDQAGNPLVDFNICTDISSIKPAGASILTIKSEGRSIREIRFDAEDNKCTFSKRELDILYLISRGLNSTEIGAELFISFHTVNTHRKNMLHKTHCKNSLELVNYAKNKGLMT